MLKYITFILPITIISCLTVQAKPVKIDHAGVIRSLNAQSLKNGAQIYNGLCVNCHGADGKTAPLPTARAFRSQPLKFGGDFYAIYQTLSKGNGLMGPMLHLNPVQRYEVAYYIRETFLKPGNNDYKEIDDDYLKKLPKGNARGDEITIIERDYGPGLASQLYRNISSVMTVKLGSISLSYNLHSMDQAEIWAGKLNLSNTQHAKLRGGGVAEPDGEIIKELKGWAWAHDGTFEYPKEKLLPRGPIPEKWMRYNGHYLYNNQMIFSYSIDGRQILELPGAVSGSTAVTQTLEISPGKALKLSVAQPSAVTNKSIQSTSCRLNNTFAKVFGDTKGLNWSVDNKHRMILNIPADKTVRQIKILRAAITGDNAEKGFADIVKLVSKKKMTSLKVMTKGGDQHWPDILKSEGKISTDKDAYVIDTLTIPKKNPWKSWFRTSALDFFDDGRMAVATHGGDIWIVSGIDKDMKNLKWKRFAAGLYEPFGLKIVNGVIYATCKDRLTRFHDYNKDGEADFYESFYADYDVSTFFHAYNFDLQLDKDGNLYYAKAGQYTSHKLPGSVVKVTPDGKAEIFCTGFRTPNGMGISKDGRLTVSDNEGNWMPSSKVSMIKKGGFYGYVQTKTKPPVWQPDGGRIDPKKVSIPKTFDQPLVWLPRPVDNSSGGQLWVDDKRWGPLSGRMIHSSFGQGHLYYLLIQDVDDIAQAAFVKLPQKFMTGIMRIRVNPSDGQVYGVGLNGWNGGGRKGLIEGGIQRLRYTGNEYKMINNWSVEKGAINISFNFKVDKSIDPSTFKIQQWNYLWSTNYGSKQYKRDGKIGKESMTVEKIIISPEGTSIKLIVPDLTIVNQVEAKMTIKSAAGGSFNETLWMTINKIPE